MILIQEAWVLKILADHGNAQELRLTMDHPVDRALNYPDLTGPVRAGDRVFVNTTAATLGLGTGGVHFILANLTGPGPTFLPGGHGMKLRYTPMQMKVSFTEEGEGAAAEIYNRPLHLTGVPVFFCELHSMVPPLCAGIKHALGRDISIGYIYTDQGALPAGFSNNLRVLRAKGLVDAVITPGNAFGGDYECVNIYTAFQTAVRAACHVIIAAMGPGITGTGTRYGFSGLESAFHMEVAHRAGAVCFYIPRILFQDQRPRHFGLSHHSQTLLGELTEGPVEVVLPLAPRKTLQLLMRQAKEAGILLRHRVSLADGALIEEAMEGAGLSTDVMGRRMAEEPLFFRTIGAAVRKWRGMYA